MGVGEEGRLLVSGWWQGGGKNLYCRPHVRSAFLTENALSVSERTCETQ